ncbi:MAG: ATP-binding protein [Balneola sp.]
MGGFLLTPDSIPLLAKLLLALIVTGYVFFYKPKSTSIKWFAGYLAGYTLLDFFALTGTAVTANWSVFSLPLQYLASIVFTFCYVQFAYQLHEDTFPKERNSALWISAVIGSAGVVYLFIKMFTTGYGDYEGIQILVPYPLLMITWAAIVFFRKHRLEKRKSGQEEFYRGYFVFVWLASVAVLLSFTPALDALGIIDQTTFALVFFVTNLIIFAILTAAFFRYVAQYSSILIKLVGVSLVLFLALIGIQGYLIIPEEIRVNPELNPIEVHKTLVPYAWFLISSCVAVLTIFPVFYNRSVLEPLKSIIKGIDKVNEGNLGHKIPVSSSDELGLVGEHLNKMSDNLKKANAELKDYTEGLEQKVHERTEKLQQQTKELERLQNLRTKLFQDISHELRTPITLISGPLQQLINSDKEFDEYTQKQLHLSVKNSERLKKLVEQIIELNRLEFDQLTVHYSYINVSERLKILCTSFESYIEEQGLNLKISILEEPIFAKLDEDKFEKIINNLISNAIKFTPEDGDLSVSLIPESNFFSIQVQDTGIGIPENEIPYIFDRFTSASKTNVDYKDGLGVGLALTKEYVELQNGSIHVKSELGKGSTFTLTLPQISDPVTLKKSEFSEKVIDNGANKVDSKEPTSEALVNTHSSTILLLEDNKDMADYITSVLEDHSYKVEHAFHGKQGLEKLKDLKPDLIVSDIMMPQMDGMSFLKKVRELPDLSDTPTIFLSALSGMEKQLEGFRLGVNDYLVKPFNPEELICRIQNLISFRKVRKQFTVAVSEDDTRNLDEELIQKLTTLVETQLGNSQFNMEELSAEVAMSRSTMYREVKRITGLSAGAFVKEIRLLKARQKLESRSVKTLGEVAAAVGFSTPNYFTKLYKKRFGKHPSDYLN